MTGPISPIINFKISASACKTIRAALPLTGAESDRGAFKTPGLRNVELHAPYMHDGSLPTLRAVIDYYDRGGGPRPGKSPFLNSHASRRSSALRAGGPLSADVTAVGALIAAAEAALTARAWACPFFLCG